MSDSHEERRIRQLVRRLEDRLYTTQVLAELLLKNADRRPSDLGPYLNDHQEGCLMDAVIHLSRSNHDDFLKLVDLTRLPSGLYEQR